MLKSPLSLRSVGVSVRRIPVVAISFDGILMSFDSRALPGMNVWPSAPRATRTLAVCSTRPLGSMPVS